MFADSRQAGLPLSLRSFGFTLTLSHWRRMPSQYFGKPQTISDVEFGRDVGAGHFFSGGEVAG
jgi:hypothetical protein